MAAAEARVYTVSEDGKRRAIFVDEQIRHKTLFEPGSDEHADLDEIIVPLEARYWVRAGNWARTLVPGEAAMIPRKTPHDSGTATNLIGTRFLVLLFDQRLDVLAKSKVGGIKLPPGAVSWLKGIFRFARSSPNTSVLHALKSLEDFFRDLAHTGERLDADSSHADPMVTQLVRLLETPDTPTLEDLGTEIGLTPAHLQRRFKAAFGCSPLQYANAWKLEAVATELGKNNTLPLVEIATEYGFNDQKHFRTLFQRRFGVTPSTYRKNPPPRK